MTNRRDVLKLTGAATVAAGTLPAMHAAEAALAAPVTADRDELLARYSAWLHMERRLLAMEMYPGRDDAERWVPHARHATAFHFPFADGQSWCDVPQPSTRAALVLGTVGVFTGHDPNA